MAMATPTCAFATSMLSGSLVGYGVYHCYTFDGFQCLKISKGNIVRPVICYLQLLTAGLFFTWTTGFTVIKYTLGYVPVPTLGYWPAPPQVWPHEYARLIRPMYACLIGAFVLSDAVGVEEWLYWTFLLRTVHSRRPGTAEPASTSSRGKRSGGRFQRLSRAWSASGSIVAWLTATLINAVVQIVVVFAGTGTDAVLQTVRLFITVGAIGLVTALASLGLVLIFPRFINQIAKAGASTEVVGRLKLFHELNKFRTLFRFVFAICCLIAGIDANTERKVITTSMIASDFLWLCVACSFYVTCVLNWMAYLPIKYGSTGIGGDAGAQGAHHQGFQRRRRQTRALGGLGGFGRRQQHQQQHGVGGGVGGDDLLLGSGVGGSPIAPKRQPRRPRVPGTDRIMDIHAALDAEPEQTYQDQIFSANQEQHRTLVQMLRERGHIGDDEEVPEDVRLRRLDE